MAYTVMSYIPDRPARPYDLYSHDLYSYGLCSNSLHSYAYIGMACTVWPMHLVAQPVHMTYIVMTYIVIAYIVIVYIVMSA